MATKPNTSSPLKEPSPRSRRPSRTTSSPLARTKRSRTTSSPSGNRSSRTTSSPLARTKLSRTTSSPSARPSRTTSSPSRNRSSRNRSSRTTSSPSARPSRTTSSPSARPSRTTSSPSGNRSSRTTSSRSLSLPNLILQRKVLKKGDLFVKSFGRGLCTNMLDYHTKQGEHGIPRRQATNNTEINTKGSVSKIIRQSCIQDTFNYLMPLKEAQRALDYYIPTMDGVNRTGKWKTNAINDSSLLCIKLNENIDIIEVNSLTDENLKKIIIKFLSTPNRKQQEHKFRSQMLKYFKTFKTGNFFNDDFTNFIISEYPESWSLPNMPSTSMSPSNSSPSTTRSPSNSSPSSFSPEYIISKVLFILFKFIFGINMTVLEQVKFLENIIKFCNLPKTKYEEKKWTYGWSLSSKLGNNTDFRSWASLFKTTPKNVNLKGQRCSYNGFDQLFCFVLCQIDEYGYNYVDNVEEIFPDSGNEIALFTNNYVSKSLGNKNIYSCELSYIHRKNELYKHSKDIPKNTIDKFKEIIKIATFSKAKKSKRRKTQSKRMGNAEKRDIVEIDLF
uniref:Uncharacterized protein n=1 Tax=viral metagenome TaxID=1070528 RepID=A0A6C0J860_9ZZZZ